MSSQASANALFAAAVNKHTIDSPAAIQMQEQLARTLFGVSAAQLSPMQLQTLQMASVTAANSGLLGVSNGGAAFTDIYKGIMSSGGVMTSGGMSYGHSPQSIAAANSMMNMTNAIVNGDGQFSVGVGGNAQTMAGVLKQRFMRGAVNRSTATTSVRREKGESFGKFMARTSNKLAMTSQDRADIVRSEMEAEVYKDYESRVTEGKGHLTAEARRALVAAQIEKDKKSGKFKERVSEIRRAQTSSLQAELDAEKKAEIEKVKNSNLSDAQKQKKIDALEKKYTKRAGKIGIDIMRADVNLATDEDIERAARVADGKMEYTGVTNSFKKEERAAMRRAAMITKEMSEVFGTEDADQLLGIAKQFGIKTLDAEKDVKNMKRIMDTAKTRAAATGRSLQDVMGEMQGIAAVGAQAVGQHGLTAAYLENATRSMQASQASRDAGMDYRTDEEVQAELAEGEQNFQRNMTNGLFALEMMRQHDPENEEYKFWSARLRDKKPLTKEEVERFERFGAAEVALNYSTVDPRKRQEVAMNSELAEAARNSMQAGVVEEHAAGQVAGLLGRASLNTDGTLYKAMLGPGGVYGSSAEASKAMTDILTAYGGSQKELKDDFTSLTDLNGITDETDRAEAKRKWKEDQLNQARRDGASDEQIRQLEASYNELIKLSDSGQNGAFMLTQINALQSQGQLNNAVGTRGQVISDAQQLAMYRDEGKKALKKAADGSAEFGGLNLDKADAATRAVALLTSADAGMEWSNKADILSDNGTFNVEAFNSQVTTKNTAGLKREGADSARFMAANAVMVRGKDGRIDKEALLSSVDTLDKQKSGVLREALGLSKDADLRAEIDKMSPAEIEMKLNQSRANGMSVITDDNGSMMLSRNNDATDKALTSLNENNTIQLMGSMGIGTAAINKVGRKLSAGKVVKDEEMDDAKRDLKKSSTYKSLSAVTETMGITGGVIEKDGKKFLQDSSGTMYDVSNASAVGKLYAQAMEKDVNLQPTMKAAAEQGDPIAALAMAERASRATSLYTKEGAQDQKKADANAKIMISAAGKIAEKQGGDVAQAEKSAEEAIKSANAARGKMAALNKQRENGEIGEEAYAKRMMEYTEELTAADDKLKKLTKGAGLTKEQAGDKFSEAELAMGREAVGEAIDEYNDELDEASADVISKDKFFKDIAIKTGRTPEVEQLEIQNKLAEEAKARGAQNAKWFEAWNTQFTTGELARHNSATTIRAMARIIGKCYDGDNEIGTD